MAVGPIDTWGELDPDPEPEWPGELPEIDEEWNDFWFSRTLPFNREDFTFISREEKDNDNRFVRAA